MKGSDTLLLAAAGVAVLALWPKNGSTQQQLLPGGSSGGLSMDLSGLLGGLNLGGGQQPGQPDNTGLAAVLAMIGLNNKNNADAPSSDMAAYFRQYGGQLPAGATPGGGDKSGGTSFEDSLKAGLAKFGIKIPDAGAAPGGGGTGGGSGVDDILNKLKGLIPGAAGAAPGGGNNGGGIPNYAGNQGMGILDFIAGGGIGQTAKDLGTGSVDVAKGVGIVGGTYLGVRYGGPVVSGISKLFGAALNIGTKSLDRFGGGGLAITGLLPGPNSVLTPSAQSWFDPLHLMNGATPSQGGGPNFIGPLYRPPAYSVPITSQNVAQAPRGVTFSNPDNPSQNSNNGPDPNRTLAGKLYGYG